jgi:hypothetical protein
LTSLAQDLLGALDGQRGDLLAQLLRGPSRIPARLRHGRRQRSCALFAGAALGFFDDLLRQALGIGQALGGVVAGALASCCFDALVGGGQFGLGLVGGGQAVGDLLRALVQRRGDRAATRISS